jgi:hypothetical protein
MRKVKDALLGTCAECQREIWRNNKGWVVEEYDAIYKIYLCHDSRAESSCFTKYTRSGEAP